MFIQFNPEIFEILDDSIRTKVRLDFRHTLGPPQEEIVVGHVSGLSCLWREFKI